jgi:hypothetical protein
MDDDKTASDIESDLAHMVKRMKTVSDAGRAHREALEAQEPDVQPRRITVERPNLSPLPKVKG